MVLIATVIKNEHHYLTEWLDYHLSKGFDRIYLFEDYDSENHIEEVNKCIKPNNVVLTKIEYVEGDRQLITLNNFLKDHVGDYCLFTDIDEFFYGNIKELCRKRSYRIPGKLYGCAGLIKQPKSIQEFNKDYIGSCKHELIAAGYKLFMYIKPTSYINCIHGFLQPINPNCWYDHYYYKSFEEWVYKVYDRGNYNKVKYTLAEFFKHNPYMYARVKDYVDNSDNKKLKEDYYSLVNCK